MLVYRAGNVININALFRRFAALNAAFSGAVTRGRPLASACRREVIANLSAGDALLRRASPLKKQSTGLFFDSPLRSACSIGISRSAERDQGAALDLQAFEKA